MAELGAAVVLRAAAGLLGLPAYDYLRHKPETVSAHL